MWVNFRCKFLAEVGQFCAPINTLDRKELGVRVQRAHRPMRVGRSGAVATNHPVATQAGLDVLRAGGNAFDAAVAVSLCLGVAEPHMSGLGADGFYHCYRADESKGVVYNGFGFAPPRTVKASMSRLPMRGPESVSVPGAIGALGVMHSEQGSLLWAELVAPAIAAAIDGFGVTHVYQRFAAKYADEIKSFAGAAKVFLRDGHAPPIGDFLVQDGLGASLEVLAREGAEGFYRGALAEVVAADCSKAGVPIALDDLASFRPSSRSQSASAIEDSRSDKHRRTPPASFCFKLSSSWRLICRESRLSCPPTWRIC
ncbi:Gamma-glutamyltransferase (fragment) [Burkholderia sp. 8Y]